MQRRCLDADPAANAYYRALKDRYRATLAVFHQLAPNARVSLSWGGWQARWDDPATGAGRSLFRHFRDVLRMSDFQSFQAMATDSNVDDIRAMVRTLGAYGPVSLVVVGPAWGRGLQRAMTEDHSRPPRQALAYVLANVPQGSILLVDNNLWTDLVRRGFNPNPVWFYKLDLDPAIRAKFKNGWRDIDYILLSQYTATTLKDLPLVAAAIQHSEVVGSFGDGDIAVRKVIKNAPDALALEAP